MSTSLIAVLTAIGMVLAALGIIWRMLAKARQDGAARQRADDAASDAAARDRIDDAGSKPRGPGAVEDALRKGGF